MVGEIYEIKNKVIEQVMKDLKDKGADRVDGDMVDMIKDLAEAEKSCWEAEYYRSVVEAMNGPSGYMPAGYQGQGGRSGWQNQYGSGRGGRRGYGDYREAMDEVRHYMQSADPQERERMRSEMRAMADGSM